MIKIVLFDAVGVLFPVNRVVGDDLARRYGLTEEQLARMWKGFYIDYTVGKLSTNEFLDTFAATYNIPREQVTEDVFTKSFLRAITPMPGMEVVLQKLKSAGVIMAMLSDTSEMFAEARRAWLFSEYFDHIFLSFEIGYKKPDARAFQAVTKHYKVHPEEIFFIDDNPENVIAAQKLGLHGAVFKNAESLTNALVSAHILSQQS